MSEIYCINRKGKQNDNLGIVLPSIFQKYRHSIWGEKKGDSRAPL